MKLTKNKSGVYAATIKTLEGKSRTISTRVKDRDEAKRIVKESGIEDLERAARAGRLTREAIGYITTGKRLTMEKAIQEWVQWLRRTGKAERTVSNFELSVRSWVSGMKLESVPPASVSEKQIFDWVNKDSEAKYVTRTAQLAAIRRFFYLCSARGWSIGNPAREVVVRKDKLDQEQMEPEVREPFTDKEITMLLKDTRPRIVVEAEFTDKKTGATKTKTYYEGESDREAEAARKKAVADMASKVNVEPLGNIFWHFALSIGRELGLRLGAICQLEWDCFSRAGKVIINKNKRNKRLELPISSELNDLITEVPFIHKQYLFPEQRAIVLDATRRNGLSMAFGRICKRLGIEGKSFHCLRHSVATSKFAKADKAALAKKLVEHLSLEEIAALLGHTSTETTKGYLH